MNGQHGNEQGGQGGQESHLSFLLNAANGQNALMGYPQGGGIAGAPAGLRYGVSDASLEEQILQRASTLRTEALMQQQQQQQQQQRQHQLSAYLAALQQQHQQQQLQQLQQLGLNPNHLAALSAQEQEALLGRASALRELGIAGGPAGGPASAAQYGAAGGGMERLQQLEFGRLEELERRRQQLAALANLSGGGRPAEVPPGNEMLGQDGTKIDSAADRAYRNSNTSAEKSKDDLRKTPGTVIVPCRARGMPMDHNFKTAYFVISEDAKHGGDLVCSYFACRNGGVKFRYCAHCMAPVAKRNFCRRHDHGMSSKAGDVVKGEEASMDQSERTAIKEEPEEAVSQPKIEKSASFPVSEKETSKPSLKASAEKDVPRSPLDVLSKAATSSFLMQAASSRTEGQGKRKKPSEDVEKDSADDEATDDASDEAVDVADLASISSISSKRCKMWSTLLMKRPRTKDPRHLSSWLNEVLTVSDFESSPERAEPADPKATESESSDTTEEKGKSSEEAKDCSSANKEKETGEKEKKKRKTEAKSPEDEVSNSKSKKDEGSSKKSERKLVDGSDKKSPNMNGSKDSPLKKEPGDGFAGSFADWRDRKKEKALSKKGTGSLRN